MLSGLIDVDQSTQGEIFIDLCYGLASGSDPESGSFLTFEQLQKTLSIYHQCLPLSEDEISMLQATFAYAFLETLNDLSASKASTQDISATQNLLHCVLNVDCEELLGSSS